MARPRLLVARRGAMELGDRG
ncbi:hypothetical protein LINPERPRIM_LOCUS17821 [Linum perenne]